jgi:hypothetical protein
MILQGTVTVWTYCLRGTPVYHENPHGRTEVLSKRRFLDANGSILEAKPSEGYQAISSAIVQT